MIVSKLILEKKIYAYSVRSHRYPFSRPSIDFSSVCTSWEETSVYIFQGKTSWPVEKQHCDFINSNLPPSLPSKFITIPRVKNRSRGFPSNEWNERKKMHAAFRYRGNQLTASGLEGSGATREGVSNPLDDRQIFPLRIVVESRFVTTPGSQGDLHDLRWGLWRQFIIIIIIMDLGL